MWSQYLEVAIGPDAEIFTKSPVLSTVGWGAEIGVRSDSTWNNPEPEVVLLVAPDGRALGATLGNDVNLRDFEGRRSEEHTSELQSLMRISYAVFSLKKKRHQ